MGLYLVLMSATMVPSSHADEATRVRTVTSMQALELKLLSASIGYHALLARYGIPDEIRSLRESRDAFDRLLRDLFTDLRENRRQAAIQSSMATLSFLKRDWSVVRSNIDEILRSQELLLALPIQTQKIRELTARLGTLADEIIEIGASEKAGAGTLYLAGRQTMLSERIAKNIVLFGQTADADTAVAIAQFGKDTKLFKQTLIRLRQEMPTSASAKLDESGIIFEELENIATAILKNAPSLFVAQRSAQLVFEQSNRLTELCKKLEESVRNAETPAPKDPARIKDQRVSLERRADGSFH